MANNKVNQTRPTSAELNELTDPQSLTDIYVGVVKDSDTFSFFFQNIIYPLERLK